MHLTEPPPFLWNSETSAGEDLDSTVGHRVLK